MIVVQEEGLGVRLFDLLGRDMLELAVPLSLSGNVEIDVPGIPAGVYRAVVEGRAGDIFAVRSVRRI